MKQVYYAHCLAIYNTPQELRDIELLERLGFTVVNPNSPVVDAGIPAAKRRYADDWFVEVFKPLVQSCDAVTFRALPDGTIPSGVAKELEFAEEFFLPVFELPSARSRRTLTLDQTRAFLAEIGQR